MPDRFDLMEKADVLSSLGISSMWCERVNRTRLDDSDLQRLLAGTEWLRSVAVGLSNWLDGLAVDMDAFDSLPSQPDRPKAEHPACDQVVNEFNASNRTVLRLLIEAQRRDWCSTKPYTPGTRLRFIDVARHIARVSQTSSVDAHALRLGAGVSA